MNHVFKHPSYYKNLRKMNDFEKEEKTSGGAVFEAGVKQSKESTIKRP